MTTSYMQHFSYQSPIAEPSLKFPYTKTYYFRDSELGRGFTFAHVNHGTLFPPESQAFVCPYCGDIWARTVVFNSKQMLPFTTISRQCEKHPWHSPYYPVPGSLDVYWSKEEIAQLPLAVLNRELYLRFQKEKDYV